MSKKTNGHTNVYFKKELLNNHGEITQEAMIEYTEVKKIASESKKLTETQKAILVKLIDTNVGQEEGNFKLVKSTQPRVSPAWKEELLSRSLNYLIIEVKKPTDIEKIKTCLAKKEEVISIETTGEFVTNITASTIPTEAVYLSVENTN